MYPKSRIGRSVTVLLIPLMICLPVLPKLAAAQSMDAASACVQGQADAKSATSGVWYLAGCLGLVGVLIAYLVAPTPPATALIGQSPDYVVMYTDCYQRAGKSAQGQKALTGCVIATLVWGVYYFVVVSAVLSQAKDDAPQW